MSSNETGKKCVEAETYKANWNFHLGMESLQRKELVYIKLSFHSSFLNTLRGPWVFFFSLFDLNRFSK